MNEENKKCIEFLKKLRVLLSEYKGYIEIYECGTGYEEINIGTAESSIEAEFGKTFSDQDIKIQIDNLERGNDELD